MRRNLFTFFVLLTLIVKAQNADIRLLNSINSRSYPNWDHLMLGTSVSVYAAFPITILIPAADALIYKNKDMKRNAMKSAVGIGLASITTTALKYAVQRPRPKVSYPDIIIERDKAGALSFPSGHTTVAFSSATVLSLTYKKWYITLPAYLYAGLVAYSRMRLGMHYPSDVLTGAVIGTGAGLLTWKLDERFRKRKVAPKVE